MYSIVGQRRPQVFEKWAHNEAFKYMGFFGGRPREAREIYVVGSVARSRAPETRTYSLFNCCPKKKS